ncbi:biotin-dependent carboxyltransferase family protein [Marinimicrobium agarilyticum]|uniref:5-oxoprolinase subunit C family protein n=1 Tax=Marinimicrobium agarilyticum TaxID=306546 RepID=UPI00041A0292|nr:biotin-dependent carboxyltransferase family protein [Marinimicrobium agarilyticum]
MTSGGLKVIKPGPLTLLQDLGRFGYQHLGLSPGGAADEHAFRWANRLLGNDPNAPALEVTLGGVCLLVERPLQIALTGADQQANVNGRPINPWCTHTLAEGDRLQFGFSNSGVRAYLAVRGGFDVAPCFGSVATVTREKMGGLDGSGAPLKEGDVLPCPDTRAVFGRTVPSRFIPDYRKPVTLRLMISERRGWFSAAALERLYRTAYRLSSRSDRMGARLEGETVASRVKGIVSEPIPFGAVQVPPDGLPIVLLKDRQTIGGYPKIGTVHPLDAFALAQCQPGGTVRFAPATLEECQRE